jgi:hypothetical protein
MDASPKLATPPATRVGASTLLAPLELVVLVALFVAAGVSQLSRLSALASPDIWRHVSVGSWILDNRSIPHHTLFSQGADLPWVDSSWLFDVLTASVVKILGLRGLLFLGMTLGFAIAIAVFVLARGKRRGFWSGTVLTAIALYLLAGLPLRSSLVSVLFFSLTLTLIANARSTRAQRSFYRLPLLFLLWSNLDIQFVYGLVTLALFWIAEVATTFAEHRKDEPQISDTSLRMAGLVTAISFAATLCNPYGYDLWGAAVRSVSFFAADPYIAEMHALRFRQPQDYVLLLLVMTAFFAIGRRHARDPYSILLLTLCSIVSFHLQRDAWVVILAAVSVLSLSMDATRHGEPLSFNSRSPSRMLPASVVAALFALIAIFVTWVPAGRDALLAKISEKFPVRASDYVQQHNLPKPLFNDYDWGSFLTWYLPQYPVAIDDRTDAYGENLTVAYFKLTTGQVPLQDDAALSRASTILLPADSEMGKALSTLPGYKQVYLDDQAMVLVREN